MSSVDLLAASWLLNLLREGIARQAEQICGLREGMAQLQGLVAAQASEIAQLTEQRARDREEVVALREQLRELRRRHNQAILAVSGVVSAQLKTTAECLDSQLWPE